MPVSYLLTKTIVLCIGLCVCICVLRRVIIILYRVKLSQSTSRIRANYATCYYLLELSISTVAFSGRGSNLTQISSVTCLHRALTLTLTNGPKTERWSWIWFKASYEYRENNTACLLPTAVAMRRTTNQWIHWDYAVLACAMCALNLILCCRCSLCCNYSQCVHVETN